MSSGSTTGGVLHRIEGKLGTWSHCFKPAVVACSAPGMPRCCVLLSCAFDAMSALSNEGADQVQSTHTGGTCALCVCTSPAAASRCCIRTGTAGCEACRREQWQRRPRDYNVSTRCVWAMSFAMTLTVSPHSFLLFGCQWSTLRPHCAKQPASSVAFVMAWWRFHFPVRSAASVCIVVALTDELLLHVAANF